MPTFPTYLCDNSDIDHRAYKNGLWELQGVHLHLHLPSIIINQLYASSGVRNVSLGTCPIYYQGKSTLHTYSLTIPGCQREPLVAESHVHLSRYFCRYDGCSILH